MLGEYLAQDRAVAATLVFAVTAYGEVALPGKPSEQCQEMFLVAHLLAITPGELLPIGMRGLDESRARRELRQPDVVIV
jgi:hypothetical protein